MTDEDTGGTPKAPAGRKNRRHSPWPLVIVVALPILSAILHLPALVTLVLLLLGTALLVFSPHLAEHRPVDPKKAWTQLVASHARLKSAHAALMESPSDPAARKRYSTLLDECLTVLNSRPESDWGPNSVYVPKIRSEIEAISAPVALGGGNPAPVPSEEIGRLADLRKQGLISDRELNAFSERFKLLAAEKACGVLDTIAGLHLQCREGAMAEEDYHAALWSLLDKLDHEDGAAAPKPATPTQFE